MTARLAAAYAVRLAQQAHRIVGAVHDDGPDELLAAIRKALGLVPPPDTDPVVALCTVLAAMVDPNTSTEQRLGWVTQFDRPARPAPPVAAPVSEFLGAPRWDEIPPARRGELVARLLSQGLSTSEVAARLGTTQRAIQRRAARLRAEQHKEAG